MKTMGFKDRGHSKYCFTNYEDSPDEEAEDDDIKDFNLPIKRNR